LPESAAPAANDAAVGPRHNGATVGIGAIAITTTVEDVLNRDGSGPLIDAGRVDGIGALAPPGVPGPEHVAVSVGLCDDVAANQDVLADVLGAQRERQLRTICSAAAPRMRASPPAS